MDLKDIKNSKLARAFKLKSVKPPRAKLDIDRDYQNEALMLGHKTRVLAMQQVEIDRLQAEIDGHLQKLLQLNDEGVLMQQQQIEAQKTPEPPKETA